MALADGRATAQRVQQSWHYQNAQKALLAADEQIEALTAGMQDDVAHHFRQHATTSAHFLQALQRQREVAAQRLEQVPVKQVPRAGLMDSLRCGLTKADSTRAGSR
jgi:hypothetical protein